MKQLSETVDLMQSADYKERFAAEYYQLENRFLKLFSHVPLVESPNRTNVIEALVR